MTIIFYDIPSKLPGIAWSPNTWKVRFLLNYKRIPYKTEWIEYPDIVPFSISHAIPPTESSPIRYTPPAIHDPSTGIYLAESLAIAQYLESTYPTLPPVFPAGTLGLQRAFTEAFDRFVAAYAKLVVLRTAGLLHERSEEYFRKTRAARFGINEEKGQKLEDAIPTGYELKELWEKVKNEWGTVDGWYADKEAFVMGDVLSWADCVVAGDLTWMKVIWTEESELRKDFKGWHGGRWGNLLDKMEEYSQVN